VILSEKLSTLESCFLRPIMRNSFLEVLRVRRFADIQLHSGLEVGGS